MTTRKERPFGPLCHWEYSDRCVDKLNDLYARDPLGYGRLTAMVKRSEGPNGLEPLQAYEDVRVPLSFAPKRIIDPPWVGCLKVNGDRVFKRAPKLVWLHRLYFGLPRGHQDLVVGVGVWSKNPASPPVQGKSTEGDKQKRYIGETMKHLKWWFGQKGYGWEDL